MKKRILGRTDLAVSELSLGGLFVSSHGAAFEQSKQAVLRALELGVNYIDTAPTYFDSEEVLGKALEGVETPFYLSTKIGGRLTPFLPQDPACLRRSVEESLERLKRDRVDILMVHEPDRPWMYDWWADEEYNGPVLEVLDELKQEGLVDYTGLGSTTAYHIEPIIRTGRFDILLTALNYSLLWREAAHCALPAAHEHNMGIVIARRCNGRAIPGPPRRNTARGAVAGSAAPAAVLRPLRLCPRSRYFPARTKPALRALRPARLLRPDGSSLAGGGRRERRCGRQRPLEQRSTRPTRRNRRHGALPTLRRTLRPAARPDVRWAGTGPIEIA